MKNRITSIPTPLYTLFLLLPILTPLHSQSVVESIGTVPWNTDDLRDALPRFASLYARRPIRSNTGGMNSAHMFHVWFLTRYLKPKHIIESGVWKGQSTWLFDHAAPYAHITAIDPKLGRLIYRSKRATYTTTDFSKYDWSRVNKEETLCFFDDHQGAFRIKQCYERGFKHILYEDNYPGPGGNFNKNALSVKATLKANGPEAEYLRSIIKTYYEFPPIFAPRFGKKRWTDYATFTHPALLEKRTEKYQDQYLKDADGYRWIAYIELH